MTIAMITTMAIKLMNGMVCLAWKRASPLIRHYHQPVKYTTELMAHPSKPITIPVFRLLDEKGKPLVSRKELPSIKESMLKQMLQFMITVNIMDHVLYEAQRQGRISFYLTSAGEEATHVGSAAALLPEDIIYGQYREVGSLMWRGFSVAQVMNQCYGNKDDLGKGRQMPVHYGSAAHNFQTISSPLGTQIPQAAGSAYYLKLANRPNVTMCYFGDGAASEGDFHAGLNIAATTESPVLYFCRNNQFAISTTLREQYRGDGIAARGPAYGIPAFRVDGNDILAVYQVTKKARELALEKNTPVLIEAITYRVGHHSTSDDSLAYREKVEVEQWQQNNNPITRFQQFLTDEGLWNDALDQEYREKTRKSILNDFSLAEKKPKPSITELFTDVYAEMPWHLRQQQKELEQVIHKFPQQFPLAGFDDSTKDNPQ